jgi:hypothetical protein
MPERGGRGGELETEIGFWNCEKKRKKRTCISEEEEEEEVLKVKQDLQLCIMVPKSPEHHLFMWQRSSFGHNQGQATNSLHIKQKV